MPHPLGCTASASVILTGLLSSLLFGTTIDLHFALAVINVTCSIALYSNVGGVAAHGGGPAAAQTAARVHSPSAKLDGGGLSGVISPRDRDSPPKSHA